MSEYTSKHSDAPEGANNKKILYYAIIAIASALLVGALVWGGIKIFGGKDKDFDKFKNPSYVENVESTDTTSSTELPANPINFEAIQAENPDVCAWIEVDGTIIDYPILQSSPEADDNFYLDHDINGEKKRAGSIYIQKLNHDDFSDPNTLIYGHNMLNGTMFGQLKKFRGKDFFEQNRNIYIYTPGHILKYEIISAFVYDDRHIMNSFNFSIDSECKEFFDTCINPQSLTKQVVDNANLTIFDKIITLSTCTSNDSERYLVIGKLISDTETAK